MWMFHVNVLCEAQAIVKRVLALLARIKQADDKVLQQAKEAELAATQKAYEHARKKTILKLQSAIEQVHNQIGAETELDTGHEQVEIGSKPRGDKIMLKLTGAMEKASKSQGTTTLSGHMQATCENTVVNETPQSETPKRQWGFLSLILQLHIKSAWQPHRWLVHLSLLSTLMSSESQPKELGPGIISYLVESRNQGQEMGKAISTNSPPLGVWSIPEDNLIHTLTEIAKVIYPTFSTLDNIHPNMPIFAVISKSAPVWMVSFFGLYGHCTCGLLSCQ
ncbi:hypothetical protein EDD16DRAFT_1528969 [Pisolithus croceorrhizus]|nr:hypothetical protein EDD16DRAFT_1528969 [Pisolithus croceorrhizus]KAI6131769.1 hypothetical protein EV401DRAFT_1883969 [Pisolithus croceorrhizus]KAI6162667.1 hypothetical protein EDD17DRAFT_1507822 [Pisolithus thermaeus]